MALAILVFRRLPFLLAFYKWIPDVKTLREAAFVGWFGPMGVGAIFISALAREALPEPHEDGPIGQAEMLASTIQPVCFFIVLTSVLCRKHTRLIRLQEQELILSNSRRSFHSFLFPYQASTLNHSYLV